MPNYELSITRDLPIPAAKLYQGWTDPELLVQWFTPKPWETASATLDVRAGGSILVIMRDPEGQDMPNPGIYLEVIPNKKIVFTDAYTRAWEPSGKPFMTGISNCSGLSQRKIVKNKSVPRDLVGITELGWKKTHAKHGRKEPGNCVS